MGNKITIIDYGICNIKSVINMLRRVGAESQIATNASDLVSATKLILPGIGSFDTGINNLEKRGLLQILNKKVLEENIPVLGICLGMQLFSNKSEEGKLHGLSWIDGNVKKFNFISMKEKPKIPNMGWNYIHAKKDHFLFQNIPQPMRFYFVHSFHYVCRSKENDLAKTHYGYEFTCAIVKDNIIGVQFHPEKSHKYGMQLLRNFVEYA
jgi:glutamine amidotransferase